MVCNEISGMFHFPCVIDYYNVSNSECLLYADDIAIYVSGYRY